MERLDDTDDQKMRKLAVSAPKRAAAGVTGIAVSASAIVKKVGLKKGAKLLLQVNKQRGFDCPGCAWPDPLARRSWFEFCENGAKAVADEATRKQITADFFSQWSIEQLAAQSGQWLNQQGRLTQPMLRRQGADHYEPISWSDAFDTIARALQSLDSPHEAAFYTSGRTSNEAAFLYQLFVRRFGTNNLPDCSNLCHESSGLALSQAIGSGKGTVTLEDFDLADAIFVFGQNPGSNHPRMLTALQRAKRRGARIVSINPLDETGLKRFKNPQEVRGILGTGTPLADLTLRVRINGDVALLKGILKEMLEQEREGRDVLDHEFIDRYTSGFDVFRQDIESVGWDVIVLASGVEREQIRQAADIAAQSKGTICCWAMGLTQHKNAVANIQQIVNLLLLRGNLGKPGAGACPVRGHSNVQGDRTMGIWERPTREFLDALAKEFGFHPPESPGFDSVNTVKAMHAGKIKVFVALGGNFARATPDTNYTYDALKRCALTVQISTKLNQSHVRTGQTALILPALGRTELDVQPSGRQFVTVENSMGVVHRSQGSMTPASQQLKSEVRIVAEMAAATLGESDPVDWLAMADNYSHIRDHIAQVVPGFDRFNERMEGGNGVMVLPHPVRDTREFRTATGRAQFTVHPIDPVVAPHGSFLMTTLRSHDQFNTTIYSLNDRYRGIRNRRRVLFMNAKDIDAAGVSDGALIDITSHFQKQTRRVEGFRVVSYDIPRGCVASYFPETNDLVPIDSVAEGSNTPAYKSVVVSIVPAGGE